MNPIGQSLGTNLVEQLAPRVLTPAFGFWAGGLLALWTSGYGRTWATGLAALPTVLQLLLLAAVLMLVAASAVIAEHLTLPVLRLLEGYWPGRLGAPLRKRTVRRRERIERSLQELTAKAFHGEAGPEDERLRAIAEQRLFDLPAEASSAMPTRLGNILRAAEDRPRARYGLDPVLCWPHLWLSLDKEPQEELTLARKGLDDAARLWLWCLLFAVWTPWSWWAPLVTLLGCPAVYYGAMLARARAYGLLMQSVFDLYRRRVYRGLRWPPPADAAGEPAAGQEVTTYLWRGIAPPGMRFATEDED
ncbi:hypothetical protein [Nonomuraea sp. NPDC003709]|uniref:hypothetical protein n=1 Tax=Nonomuraea sp. NPDC003709 TaxID=3154450 RepID=UPI0033B3B089